MKDLEASLERRIGRSVEEIMDIVERYDLSPTIRNFDSGGLFLKDSRNRTVRILSGSFNDDVVHVPHFVGDIGIVFVDGMCLGWAEKDDFFDADDRLILKTKAIQPMPDNFDFYRTCPHLEEHGGFLEDNYWECAGCGTLIRASDGA